MTNPPEELFETRSPSEEKVPWDVVTDKLTGLREGEFSERLLSSGEIRTTAQELLELVQTSQEIDEETG